VRHRATRAGTVLLSTGLLAAAVAAPALATGHHKAKPKAKKGTEISSVKMSLGKVAASSKGHVMYIFDKDKTKVSKCKTSCLSVWPAVTSASKPRAGSGISAKHLSRTKKHQVTYYGHPLYFFTGDSKKGKANGENVGGFFVISTHGKVIKPKSMTGGGPTPTPSPTPPTGPTGPSAPTTAAVVSTGTVDAATVITDDATGHTLYELSSETDGASPTFTCTSSCLSAWTPLLTKGDPTVSGSADATKLGTVTRPDDGFTQVTYNHHPLYTYDADSAAGQGGGEDAYTPPGYWYELSTSGAIH
jgi:predicted lipoprotein with Yx(FWY)xxD motif